MKLLLFIDTANAEQVAGRYHAYRRYEGALPSVRAIFAIPRMDPVIST